MYQIGKALYLFIYMGSYNNTTNLQKIHIVCVFFFLIQQLYGLSVNPNAQNQERYNIAVSMLQKGADYNIYNKRGNSPLEMCRNGQLKIDVTNFIQKK